jgi:predicted amidohydrolase YtcJ
MDAERVWAVSAGRVRTLDPERPEAECVAVRGGTIVAVGTHDEVASSVDSAGEWVDLRPATLTPGFTDSHIHLTEWALARTLPDLSDAGTMEEVLGRVREVVESEAVDAWCELRGWDPSLRRQADLADLNDAAAGRAVALIAHDLHSGWLSGEAMRRLGIVAGRADPPGGELERDAEGRPTGIVREEALSWWYEGRPRPGGAARRRALADAQSELHVLGVTGVQSVEGPDAFSIVQEMARDRELRLRILHHFPRRHLDDLIACGLRSGFGDDWVRIGGIKIFTDGALGSRTAWMLEPYDDTEGRGIRRVEPSEFADDVARAARAGLASTVHAIGDAAVRMTLEALEAAGQEGLAIPHRIEHLQCVHPDDLDRAGRAGIIASMQPSHLLTDIPIAEAAWGEERCRGVYAFRSLRRAGATLAFGSDAPVERPDPRDGFYAALARRDRDGQPPEGWFPEERLSGQEVLEAYTFGPALAAGATGRQGRLAPGYPADFVAWDGDPAHDDPDEARSVVTVATVVGGLMVHRD